MKIHFSSNEVAAKTKAVRVFNENFFVFFNISRTSLIVDKGVEISLYCIRVVCFSVCLNKMEDV